MYNTNATLMQQQLHIHNLSGLSLLIILCSMAWLQPCVAQDFIFSDFNRTPLLINPALTGNFNGKVRARAGHRNQWSEVLSGTSFQSHFVSVDTRLDVDDNQNFGFGLSGLRDVGGALDFGSKSLNFSSAYERKLISTEKSTHSIRLGLEGGIVRRSIDLSDTRWPSQHDGNGGFDPTIPAPELEGIDSDFLIADVNGGLFWQSIFSDGSAFYLGLAAHHLNRPNVSFFVDEEEKLSTRYTIHGGGEIRLTQAWSMMPTFLYVDQGEHSAFIGGALARRYFDRSASTSLQAGILVRANKDLGGSLQTNAITPTVNLLLKRLSLGIAVDITTSQLAEVSYNGAVEVSLGYVFGAITAPKVVPVQE